MPREYKLYLEDILASISKIGQYIGVLSFEEFSANSLVQDAVVRNLGIIGEAARNIPQEIREMKENIEWKKITRMRDIITPTIFMLDLDEEIFRMIPQKQRIDK